VNTVPGLAENNRQDWKGLPWTSTLILLRKLVTFGRNFFKTLGRVETKGNTTTEARKLCRKSFMKLSVGLLFAVRADPKREAPALLELIRLGRKGTKILAFFASVHIRQFFDYIDYSQQVSVTTTKLECFPFGKTFGSV
jgi:hypothetical protein